ncbi:hypothetical protein C8U37_11374 [Trichococcus patagoniensis]|uniref:Uncharacterized protein n=1 Tax=Trichococcus patagoniensis TaxID=382641 RepID=A0A2T5IIL2_9LACT|nr:hypothetical protein [Trichococcus patagoniensis]PTQ83663.1 hypothetical protein C8U37_11374 [Trichococcus patagoniensis]
MMMELDRLVKLLVEKVLRASKKQEPNGKDADAAETDEAAVSKSIREKAAKKRNEKNA